MSKGETVVDASVAIKWLFPEEDTDKALSLLESDKMLIAPSQVQFEICHVLTRYVRREIVSPEFCLQALAALGRIITEDSLTLVDEGDDLNQVMRLSLQLSHGFYDCLYLNLAKVTKSSLITADRRLYQKAKELEIDAYLLGAPSLLM